MSGKFISIEGIEGAGKSTQISFIESLLTARGLSVVVTREPGGTALSEQIRDLLLQPNEQGMAEDTELLLMFAARAEHIQKKIKPALARGDWVVCDRFVDATFAYQGGGRGIAHERIQTIADWTLAGLKTDLTLLFDLPVAVGQRRVSQRKQSKDRFELEQTTFFENIRQCYLQRVEAEPERIKLIDANQSIVHIQQQIRQLVDHLF